MIEATVTDVVVARGQISESLRSMIVWSVGAHVGLIAFLILMPESWRGRMDEGPKTVMTISLGGAPGPSNGGLTTMGGRTVQAPAPVEPLRKVEAPPAPKVPEMALPTRSVRRPRPAQPKEAPVESTARTPSTGEPQEGSTRVDTGTRGKGFGLTTSGGGGTGVQVDFANFCCPEYLSQMITLIQRNWNSKQGTSGSVVMKFTIARVGSIENVQVEQSSGFLAHELAAQRALLLTRLPELPLQFPNPNLTVHMRFDYER